MLVSLHTLTAQQFTTIIPSPDIRMRMHIASLADADVNSTGKRIFASQDVSRLNVPRDEDDCVNKVDVPVFEGPIGKIGEEPQFAAPKPKWYYCETLGL